VKKLMLRSATVRRLVYPVSPTPEDVRAFWDYMCSRHRVRVIDKGNSKEMKFVADVLDAMGILNREKFLREFTTGVPLMPFRGIYVPFTPGVPDDRYDLWKQMRVCAHEIDHIIQADTAGELSFSWDYLTNSAARAHYEAGGYRCDMELEWRYRGRLLDPYLLSILLINYGCQPADCEVMEKEIRLCIPAIKSGRIIEPAAREAVVWLDERYGRAA
jgi:hypothetical protein